MYRFVKAVPLTLALASLLFLAFFVASCGSSNQSQIRVVHAIPDAQSLDIDINTTKIFSALAFTQFQPATGYTKVASGSVTFQAYNAGSTANPLFPNGDTTSLSGSSQYTEVLTGFVSAPTLLSLTDNNTAPTSGNIEFRVIHASPSGPTPVDVYIVPPGTNISNVTPNISGLAYTQASSSYVILPFASAGYSVIVTPSGNQTVNVNQVYTPPTGSIRTVVLVDNQGGGSMSNTPVLLNDLN